MLELKTKAKQIKELQTKCFVLHEHCNHLSILLSDTKRELEMFRERYKYLATQYNRLNRAHQRLVEDMKDGIENKEDL